MISRKTCIQWFKNNGYTVSQIPFYFHIRNPDNGASMLLPNRRWYFWWSLKIHFYLDRHVWRLPWKITFRMMQLQVAFEQQSQSKNK